MIGNRSLRVYIEPERDEAERRVDRAWAAFRRFGKIRTYGVDLAAYERCSVFFGWVQAALDEGQRTRAISAEGWAILGMARDLADRMTMSHGIRRGNIAAIQSQRDIRKMESAIEEAEKRDFIRWGEEMFFAAQTQRANVPNGLDDLLLF